MKKSLYGWTINPDKKALLTASEYLSALEESNNGRLDFHILQKFLTTMLPVKGKPTSDQLRDVVEVIGQPQRLHTLVQLILHDKNQLGALKSFGHSTGMERIEIALHGQFSLRLHFWMYGVGECFTEDPHNHTYDFGSKVLSGLLVTDLFAQKEGGSINIYEIASQNSIIKPKPELIGTAKLKQITPPKGIILSGKDPSYTMFHKAIHRVRKGNLKIPVVTLNIRGAPVQDKSTFFRNETMQRANPIATKVDVESRLNLLRNILNGA